MTPQLTQDEKDKITTLKGQGYTAEQIKGYIAGQRYGAQSTVSYKTNPQSVTPLPSYGSVQDEITSRSKDFLLGSGRDLFNRADKIKQAYQAGAAGEQTKVETGYQQTGETLSGAGDIAFRALTETGKALLPQEAEQKIAEGVSGAIEKTGVVEWYNQQDPRTQRNIDASLGYLDVLTLGTGTLLTRPLRKLFSKGVSSAEKTIPALETAAQEAATGNIAPLNKAVTSTLDEATRTKVVDDFTNAYKSALVVDRQSINNKLEELARSQSFGDKVVTRDDLLKNLAQEGYVPEIEGKLAKFDSVYRDIDRRQTEIMNKLDEVLQTNKQTIKLDDLYNRANKALVENPQIVGGLTRSQAELDRLFSSYRQKFGDTLTASQVNQIRKESNGLTRAFKDSDKFAADTASELGKVTRSWLDETVKDETVRAANAEWARLNNILQTADILNNQQVDVGLLGRALGSYVTTIAASTAGISVGGPGGLVIAGVLAKMGGDAVADWLRRKAFNPEVATKIREVMQRDRSLLDRLEKTASDQNKEFLNSYFLPAKGESGYRSEVTSGAPVQVGGQTPQGAVTPGGTERVVPGAITQPGGEGAPLRRGMFPSATEAELQQFKTESFRRILENAGVNPEDAAKAIAAGVGGYLLVSYMGEDGIAPAGLAILSAIPAGARRNLIEEAAKIARTTGKTLKLPDNVADEVLRSLNEETPLTKANRTGVDLDAEEVARLDILRERAKVGPLNDEELVEAAVIMEKAGDQFPSFNQGATPATNLLEEAKKYKSAEELKSSSVYKNFTQDVIGNSKVGRWNLLNTPDSSRYAWRAANDAAVLIQNVDLHDGAFKSIVGKNRLDVIASLRNNLDTYNSEKTFAPHGDTKKIEQVLRFANDVKNLTTKDTSKLNPLEMPSPTPAQINKGVDQLGRPLERIVSGEDVEFALSPKSLRVFDPETKLLTVYRVVPEGATIEKGDVVFDTMKAAEKFMNEYGQKRGQTAIVTKQVKLKDLAKYRDSEMKIERGELIFAPMD